MPWFDIISNDGIARSPHFQVDHTLVEFSLTQLRAQFLARPLVLFPLRRHFRFRCSRSRGRRRRQQQIQHALFGGLFGAVGHLVQFFFADHVDGGFHQVAHHRFHVAADITHFGVLRSFDFYEWATRQPRQPARNFRLAHAGWPDHQNILRQHVFRDLRRQFLPAHAIAQRHRHRALGRCLPHDVLIEFRHDFARRHVIQRRQQFRLFGLPAAI